MKREDITKVAQAWNAVQEASYGKPKKEAMDPVDHKELKGKHKDRKDKDINNDGKADSTDKYLHNRRKTVSASIKGKKKDQEVEVQTSEATVNEISKKTLGSYVKKASYDAASNAAKFGAGEKDKKGGSAFVKSHNRLRGIAKATDKLTKEEIELDEVLDTPKAMDSYRNKAKYSKERAANSAVAKIFRSKDKETREHPAKELKTIAKRTAGQQMADRAAARKYRQSLRKEEVEHIEEKVYAADYNAGHEKSQFGGYRPHITHKKTGHTMYLGATSYKKPEHAKGHAAAYLKGYEQMGDRTANRMAHEYEKANKKHLHKESVEEAATHKPGVASPAGEGLSPSAKDQLAKKTPAPSDAFDANMVNKKTFDAMRASAKKAKMRTNDNPQGDKTPPKSK